jgi:hypothetical protein
MSEETSPIPKQKCGACGFQFLFTTAAQNKRLQPIEGCVSICAACGHLAIFDADLKLREPTSDEHAQLEMNPDILKAQIYRASVIGDKLKPKKA